MSPLSLPILSPISEDSFLPDALNFNIENNANQPFFTYANTHAPNGGTSIITHLEFGRAAHRIAHALRPNRFGPDGQVVALLLHTDSILYQTIIAGLVVAGLVPFPISPRNSPAAIIDLLHKVSCHRVLSNSVTLKPLIDSVKAQMTNSPLFKNVQIDEIPLLATAYPKLAQETADTPFLYYPSPLKRPSKHDTVIILHSSGSTGFPSAIPISHLEWTQVATTPDLRQYQPRLVVGGMALPSFHAFGIGIQLLTPVFGVVCIAVYPPTATAPELSPVIPTPDNTLEHTKLTGSNVVFVIPTLIQIWSTSEAAVDFLRTLEFVVYAGGPLPPKLGNRLVESGVRLHPIYGCTEVGAPTRLAPEKGDEKDWEYMRFCEHVKVRWVPQSDGTFECQFLAWERHVPIVKNLPDVDGYATADLWQPHPTKKDLWKIVARIDDVIIHTSGEKTVPGLMEVIVLSNPLVQGAVMFGRERDQTGILIEPRFGAEIDVEDFEEVASLRNKLWPTIEEANSAAPNFSRIFKEMILITSRNKPLPRAGKGTVMRKAALSLYEGEIAALYEGVQSNIKTDANIDPPASWSVNDLKSWIVKQVVDLTSGRNISSTVDVFEQGFDSLSATFLRLRLASVLRQSSDPVVQDAARSLTQNLVYAHPVIEDLAVHVVSLYNSPGVGRNTLSKDTTIIEALIKKYATGFSRDISDNSSLSKNQPSPQNVLLTGSTGQLGSQILANLLGDARVHKVYAFNRPANPTTITIQDRQLQRFKDIGLDPVLLTSNKLTFITGDTSRPDLGLDRGSYGELCRSVNVIIHNAWRLDFNLSVASYEPNIQGTRHLIDLVRSGPNASDTRFLFTSSVAIAQSWDNVRGQVPEEVLEDACIALGNGYGESKYVAERVLAKSGLYATAVRIGQISGGPPKGAWPTTEWVPILVKSSVALGCLPDTNGVVSWLLATTVAAAIVETALGDNSNPLPRALNLVHPRPIPWTTIITSVRNAIMALMGRELQVIPFTEWVTALEARAENATEKIMEDIPAIKLLEFFRGHATTATTSIDPAITSETGGLPTFQTDKMQRVSNAMGPSNLQEIQEQDVRLWIGYWHTIGYLN